MGENENVLGNPAIHRGADVPEWVASFDKYVFPSLDLMDWNAKFGQSPECRSYAKAMRQGRYTFSDCGSSNTVIQTVGGVNFDYPSQLPARVVRQYDRNYTDTCCGNCSLEIPEVRIYYFPDQTTASCYDNQTSNTTSNPTPYDLRKLVHSLATDGDTAVVSGYTLQVESPTSISRC